MTSGSLEVQPGPTRVLPEDVRPEALTPDLTDFEILSELGEGAQGRVFLARQKSLADRPVVLKISGRRGREHLSLARLQHTHIVPLYWAHDDTEQDRRTLCMPYFGTLTLDGLLAALHPKPLAERTGQDILDALDRARGAAAVTLPANGPGRVFLQQASYVQAICWIGVCLAEALEYAHERGLVHLDLKPSNVLVAGDGQPMLLDFHLAREPIAAGDVRPRGMGGTPLFMAPEQRAAMEAVIGGLPVPAAIDGRADQYGLGLVLYQALGGPVPAPTFPSLDKVNPEVSPGLADILARALAPVPQTRYPNAAELAEDLRRHLADQPLKGVANRSWGERWQKWRRRRPHGLLHIGFVLVLLALAAAGGWFYLSSRDAQARERVEKIELAWNAGQKELKERRHKAAIASFEQARALAAQTPRLADWHDKIIRDLNSAKRGQLLEQLHGLANEVRFAAGASEPGGNWSDLEAACRQLWEARQKILDFAKSEPESDAQRVRSDLLDLALIWIDLRTQRSDEGEVAARRQALNLLEEAEKVFGPSPALVHQKMLHVAAMGDKAKVGAYERLLERDPPRTAWEHYSLGRSYLLGNDLKNATTYLKKAIALQPDGFWFHFYHGHCAFRQGDYEQAVSAFRAALVAEPKQAAVFYNRGLAYAKMVKLDEALADFDKALELNPEFKAAQAQRARLLGAP